VYGLAFSPHRPHGTIDLEHERRREQRANSRPAGTRSAGRIHQRKDSVTMAKSAKHELRGAFADAKADPVEGLAAVAVGAAGVAGAAAGAGSAAVDAASDAARSAGLATKQTVTSAADSASDTGRSLSRRAARKTAKAAVKAQAAQQATEQQATMVAQAQQRRSRKQADEARRQADAARQRAALLAEQAAKRGRAARAAAARQARAGVDTAVTRAMSASEDALLSALDTPAGKRLAATGPGAALAAKVAPRRRRPWPLLALALLGGGVAFAVVRRRSAAPAPRFEPAPTAASPAPVTPTTTPAAASPATAPAATAPAAVTPAAAEGAATIEPTAASSGGAAAPVDDTMEPDTAGGNPLAGVVAEDSGAVEAVSPGATELPPADSANEDGDLTSGPAA